MQISEAAGGAPEPGVEPCRFPKLEECAHFHYERVQLPNSLQVALQTSMDQSLHSQHTNEEEESEWFMVQVTSGEECWLVQRNFENFKMLDEQLHQCIFDRKISLLPDLSKVSINEEDLEETLSTYLERFSLIADNSVNCGPVLNWLQMDNKGHRLLVPSEESRSINTPAVAAAYSVRRYVSQARDELNLEVGDMISVIDMANPGESMWWRGKRGFQVGFFPQHCVHIIGDKVPRNMPLPPPVVGSLALSPVKPVLRKHGKLITFFRSFILNRPSRRRLKQSGILKERVFGCDLGEHLLNSGKDVPTVLRSCAEFIEANGIVDGIYRLSGITSNIQKLRNAFDEDRVPDLHTEDILKDIHSVASLLKMYFRELPNPLCTYQLYQSFVNAVQGCGTALRTTETDHERLLKMREAVQKLPPPHYRTLEYLMRHLARVANHSGSTGMTTRNLAIVWAPNLLRCEALEVGGVAALQGVGVQAVVTEFLICYADLIFCDHLPNLDRPEMSEKENLLARKCRPNSLNISTPTKLITLEEARNKHLMNNKAEDCNYIEVGGGPSNLPKKYHTVIDLPPGARKRGHTKRSPLGWKLFFTRSSRSAPQGAVTKTRKISTPITINDKSVTESDLTDMRRKLRTVKSAESLTSGHSEPASTEDVLGPLHSMNKTPGHNRSVSHDSYFDTLQSSQNNSEGSLLDLSEIHLNFDLEESEMRIFSEDESLVSSPRVQKDGYRRPLTRARPEEFVSATNSVNPSPKKQARVVMSPESMSRKRTRLEDQLSDIQYIDCNTPDNVVSTTAVVHAVPLSPEDGGFSEPKNKSPRNSNNLDDKRQMLDCIHSVTDLDLGRQFLIGTNSLASPTPTSPTYKQLGESSGNTTPGFSPNGESSPSEIKYQFLRKGEAESPVRRESPNYENILTTISITYKSPPRSAAESPAKSPVYENVILNPEKYEKEHFPDVIPIDYSNVYDRASQALKVDIPTSTASLPVQEASQPDIIDLLSIPQNEPSDRPKSLSALEDTLSSTDSTLKANSSGAICNTSEPLSLTLSLNDQKTSISSNQSSGSNIQYTASLSSALPYYYMEATDRLSQTDCSLSEVVPSSTENLTTSLSTPVSPTRNSFSLNVSPTTDSRNVSNENLLETDVWCNSRTGTSQEDECDSPSRQILQNDKRKSDETESYDDTAVYQQVKYFRRSIHEVNALLELENSLKANAEEQVEKQLDSDCDSLDKNDGHVYENLEGASLRQPEIVNTNNVSEDAEEPEETLNVHDLKNKFEEKCAKIKEADSKNASLLAIDVGDKDRSLAEVSSSHKLEQEDVSKDEETKTEPGVCSNSLRSRRTYEKDGLPPCLRARNLKSQHKTRSLDENEFEKEFAVSNPRRKSFDERIGYKTNSLPKVLNQPKLLPSDPDGELESLHLAHSNEKISIVPDEKEEQKKRERIEKYKEERRRVLSEKYRSESFKEDKDVLLSRLKIFKGKEEPIEDPASELLKTRRKSTKSESEGVNEWRNSEGKREENSGAGRSGSTPSPSPARSLGSLNTIASKPPLGNSLKVRAAIFEQQNQKATPVTVELGRGGRPGSLRFDKSRLSNFPDKGMTNSVADNVPSDLKDLEFIRHRRRDEGGQKEEKRRHTYETRERENDAERLKRTSLETRSATRKEKMSPTYCIKDMKAIFESKSKQ